MKEKIFKLFACCLLTKGVERSIIADVQRYKMYAIPNSLYEILNGCENMTVKEVIEKYGAENRDYIIEYFEFLLKEDLIFFTDNPEYYPKLNLSWEQPRTITNGIIDIISLKMCDIQRIVKQFSELMCQGLQIRCFFKINVNELESILDSFDATNIQSVELLVAYNLEFNTDYLKQLCLKYKRLSIIIIYDAPNTAMFHFQANTFGNIFFVEHQLNNQTHCGLIHPNTFTVNLKNFTEGQKHNTCLNRKISVDTEGYIRNCPSMKEHYGNIRDTTLNQALAHPDFKKYWNVNKDQIKVCQDCEFRYICTDCRAYVEDPQDMYSKPLKCGYNPYTCEWEEWSTNPLKQQAIDHYQLRAIL